MSTTAAAVEPSSVEILTRPLSHNPIWSDVQRIKQDDGEEQGQLPVVPINYPAHYSDVMDLFRGILQRQEFSRRTLFLTEAVIDINSANYSAWHFRRLCLKELKSDLREELSWVATVALDTPKNYQLWHHRRCLLENLQDYSLDLTQSELRLTAEVLGLDAKNYHAWSHRQWCLKFFTKCLPKAVEADESVDSSSVAASSTSASAASTSADRPNLHLFAAELEFIDSLLQTDVRNNSAWNQRFFVRCLGKVPAIGEETPTPSPAPSAAAPSTPVDASPSASSSAAVGLIAPSFTHGMSSSVIEEEISYCASKLLQAPHNESPWNYLEGLMKQQEFEHHEQLLQLMEQLDEFPPAEAEAADGEEENGLTTRATHFPNRLAQSLLVELWDASPTTWLLAKSAAAWLAEELDPIRRKYWQWREQGIEAKIQQAATTPKEAAAANRQAQ